MLLCDRNWGAREMCVMIRWHTGHINWLEVFNHHTTTAEIRSLSLFFFTTHNNTTRERRCDEECWGEIDECRGYHYNWTIYVFNTLLDFAWNDDDDDNVTKQINFHCIPTLHSIEPGERERTFFKEGRLDKNRRAVAQQRHHHEIWDFHGEKCSMLRFSRVS